MVVGHAPLSLDGSGRRRPYRSVPACGKKPQTAPRCLDASAGLGATAPLHLPRRSQSAMLLPEAAFGDMMSQSCPAGFGLAAFPAREKWSSVHFSPPEDSSALMQSTGRQISSMSQSSPSSGWVRQSIAAIHKRPSMNTLDGTGEPHEVEVTFAGTTSPAVASSGVSERLPKELSIFTLEGPLCRLRLAADATLRDAKQAISKATGTPEERLHLERARTRGSPWRGTSDTWRDARLVESLGVRSLILTKDEAGSAYQQPAPDAALKMLLERSQEADEERKDRARYPLGRPAFQATPSKAPEAEQKATLPPVGYDLDFQRACAMPALYQSVEVDQSMRARLSVKMDKPGLVYPGLGLVVDPKSLEITDVRAAGLIMDWNAGHQNFPVGAGDRICQVNGVSDPHKILQKELRHKGVVKLFLARRDCLAPPPVQDWCSRPSVPLGCTEVILHVAAMEAAQQPGDVGYSSFGAAARRPIAEPRYARFRLQWVAADGSPAYPGDPAGDWVVRRTDKEPPLLHFPRGPPLQGPPTRPASRATETSSRPGSRSSRPNSKGRLFGVCDPLEDFDGASGVASELDAFL
eukprot:TRINITY_DN39053_c0_g1_i1.p1 TRINITY_DN39053_c0_g1~~TRINITY_DN39053_c0_g1_i1.p1  ORF type:complete len:579 (+),score=95.46 TRINITY_DN39053_c0_g1_i1:87-1823(+)